jgi:hypothetical protein
MTPRERAEKWASRVDGILGEPEEGGSPFRNELIRWVEESIQSALAERTEQCAKICDNYSADLHKSFAKRPASADSELGRSICEGFRIAAAEIRALNQPEK